MRKARSRRRIVPPSLNGTPGSVPRATTPPGTLPNDKKSISPNANTGKPPNAMQEQRKPATAEEAALTAKNYRLAKELSDLRTRHRDETKDVKRLTMENMNLASRCRTAITHIEALKKENSSQKRKIISLEKRIQKTNISPTSSSGSSREGVSENEDNIIFNPIFHTTEPAQDQKPMDLDPTVLASEQNGDRNTNMNEKKSIKTEKEEGDGDEKDVDSSSPSTKELSLSKKTIKPAGKVRNSGNDSPFGDLDSNQFFKTTFQTSQETIYDKENGADEIQLSGEDNFSSFHSKAQNELTGTSGDDQPAESGINAFEASFQTTFPSAFTSSSSEQAPAAPISLESFDVDPFFPDSSIDSFSTEGGKDTEKTNQKGRGESPPPPNHRRTSRNGKSRLNGRKAKPTLSRIDSSRQAGGDASKNKNDLFPENAFDNIENLSISDISTPPKKNKKLDENTDMSSPPPPPTEKSGAKAARARYDAAYGDKKENTINGSKIVKRVQERNLIEKETQQKSDKKPRETTPMQQRNVSSINGISSISDEIKKLDAMAQLGESAEPVTLEQVPPSKSRRRNVKQPLSYSEPTLNSKLRRGDVFFAKADISPQEAMIENEDSKQ